MQKKLKIAYPPKTSHQFYALPLSIIMSKPKMWHWYYGEFTQMYTFRDDNENIFIRLYNYESLEEYEPLENMRTQPNRLKLGKDIISLCKLMLNNDYYIYVICDNKYIKIMDVGNHSGHDILIYGYDDNKEIFNTFAYKGTYLSEFETPYREFDEAYNSLFTENYENLIIFYRLRTDRNYCLNIEKIKWHMLDYIEGVDSLRRERPFYPSPYKAYWGINIYDEIINMYTLHFKQNESINYAEPFCLYEHKKDFEKRIKYYSDHSKLKYTNDIYEKFLNIKNYAQTLLNLTIKANLEIQYNIKDDTILSKIIVVLKKIRDEELQALTYYYDYNEKIFNDL